MVKCADCGILSYRFGPTRELISLEEHHREMPTHNVAPICAESFEDFGALLRPARLRYTETLGSQPSRQINPIQTTQARNEATEEMGRIMLETFQRERGVCAGFVQWRPLLRTPKEHREMVDRQWMIDREDRRDKEMRDREDKRDQEIGGRHKWDLIVLGGVVGVMILLAGMIQADWFGKPHFLGASNTTIERSVSYTPTPQVIP